MAGSCQHSTETSVSRKEEEIFNLMINFLEGYASRSQLYNYWCQKINQKAVSPMNIKVFFN
jgi:hypothetical protein